MAVARYDGHADWYDDWRKPHVASTAREVADLLGPGEGLCLDLGCGTGLFLETLAATGRAVVGLDRSADQLRIACGRSRRILQADAAALPFRDLTFTAVAALWISTDVDDFASVLTEAARVLTPGWHEEAPWWGAFVRKRVGMSHHSLADVLNAFVRTGLAIEHVAELGDRPVPDNLAIRARKGR
ncbi:MAG TPA: class I SAM-dependent methyltransferase [Streptosporangiaceae bacterium]|nr:class I SAM-dependent methyltransferase [Streptosporangiaceae bacterium]